MRRLAAFKRAFQRLSWLPGQPIWPQMLAYALSSNTWWAVVLLTAVSVLTMLGMIAKILRYELTLIQVVSSARKMRTKLQQSTEVANVAEAEDNPQSAAASQALIDAKAATTEDQLEYAEPLMDKDSSQANDESSSDETSDHGVDLDSPDEFTSNVDETESTEAPESAAAA